MMFLKVCEMSYIPLDDGKMGKHFVRDTKTQVNTKLRVSDNRGRRLVSGN